MDVSFIKFPSLHYIFIDKTKMVSFLDTVSVYNHSIFMCVCVFVYVRAYLYVYIYIYIYIYIYLVTECLRHVTRRQRVSSELPV